MIDYIAFDGQPSTKFGIRIEEYPVYAIAKRKVETYEVPGRSGSLVYDAGTYENVVQPYKVFYKPGPGVSAYRMAESVAEWLAGEAGYRRLEDGYNPDVYRMAMFSGPIDIATFFARYGRAELEFTCMPQRWLKRGEFPVRMENGGKLFNPGKPSLPMIRIAGSGSGGLAIGMQEVKISDLPKDGLVIDCDSQNAYSGTQNKNSLLTLSNKTFPKLPEGETQIGWSGGIETVEIIPRWWIL